MIKENEISKKDKLLILVPTVLVLILTLVTTFLTLISVLFTFLSFIGIHQASDLQINTFNILQTIDNMMNIYKNFSVDLKIFVWSLISIGFTFFIYKSITTQIEDIKKNGNLTPQINDWKTQYTPNEKNSEEQNRIEGLDSQIKVLQKQLDNLLKTQAALKLELNSEDLKEAINDLKMKRSHKVSEYLNKVSSEIFDILKKHEVKGRKSAKYVYNPYLKIIVQCFDSSGIVKIPDEAINEIKKLENKYDVKIEIAEKLILDDF